MELLRMHAYTRLLLQVDFVPYAEEGIILYNGQTSTGEGDFVSLTLKDGFVEFRFNLGSGTTILKSVDKVAMGKQVKLIAKRYLQDATLSVEGQDDVAGRSEGELNSLDLAENLFIGNVPSKQKKIFDNVGIKQGFVGCMQKLRVGQREVVLRFPSSKDVLKIYELHDCSDNPCTNSPCKNSAACRPERGLMGPYTCQCQKGFIGKDCGIGVSR